MSLHTPQQSRSQQTLHSIITACERLLKERSFEQISMADIAKGAGISVGNLYNRFSDKDSLMNHVLVGCQVAMLEDLEVRLDAIESTNLRSDLRQFVDALAEQIEPLGPILLAMATRITKGVTSTDPINVNTEDLIELLASWLTRHHPNIDAVRARFVAGNTAFVLQFNILFGTPQRLYGDEFLNGLADQGYHHLTAKE